MQKEPFSMSRIPLSAAVSADADKGSKWTLNGDEDMNAFANEKS